MALTVVVPNTTIFDLSGIYSSAVVKYAKITGDTSYPGGSGYPVTPGTFGFFNSILTVAQINPGAQANYVWYDPSSKGLRVFLVGATTATEVVSGSSLATMSLDVAVYGY